MRGQASTNGNIYRVSEKERLSHPEASACSGRRWHGARRIWYNTLVLDETAITALYDNAKKPLSDEEFQLYIRDPANRAREVLEHVHYHNKRLCRYVAEWIDYRRMVGQKPRESLLLLLTPGYGGANDARASVEELCEYYSAFPHGTVPRWPITGWMFKTSYVLIDTLKKLHHTRHLAEAERHFDAFRELLSYQGEPLLPRDKFADCLHCDCASSDFFSACERNAIELTQWLESPYEDEAEDDPPHRHYATRKTLTISQAATITGLSESTIKRLDKDPKNTNYPGRNSTAKILAAWANVYRQNILAAQEVRAANRPVLGAKR